jgi:O-antigen biosynthesis protein
MNDGTSFYRGAWPLSRMAKMFPDISVYFQKIGKGETAGWAELSMFDVLFIQRPYTDWNLELLQVAKDSGLKTWVDYDDDLFNVEVHNPAFKTYSHGKVKDTISKIIKAADLVTFSTEQLKKIMGIGHTNSHVIRNATDFDLLKSLKVENASRLDNVIFWRGSKTHDNDLFKYAAPMGRIAKENPTWRFMFLGNPWFGLLNFIPAKQSVVLPAVELPKYFGFLQTLRPSISIVPLDDSVFNRSKSNIAWQEATIAESPALVPDWDEWKCSGAITYRDEDSFYEELRALIRFEKVRQDRVKQSRATIEKDFNLRDRIMERVNLLRELCFTSI